MKVHPFKKIRKCLKCDHFNGKWTFNKRFCDGVSRRVQDEDGDDHWSSCNAGLESGSQHLHITCQSCGYELLMNVKPTKTFEG